MLVRDEPASLADLRSWFELQFDAATPAHAIDWEHALRIVSETSETASCSMHIVPETSEAASRSRLFTKAALATPAPAGPIESERTLT